jgi:Sulfotransferase family
MSYSLEYRLQPDEQLCFIHIPKTAGTTLTSLLNSKFHHSEICPAEVWSELVEISPDDLAKYRLFRGHFFYDMGDLLPRKPLYMTMLRNPIERVISGYEFMRRIVPTRAEALPNHLKAQTMSLKDYVCDPDNPSMSNSQTRHLSSSRYKDDPVQWLEVAKQRLAEEFTFVGLVERFEDSMALLSYTFGWNPLAEYQNLMVAPKRPKRELEPEVWEAIATRNSLDLELYAYAKSLFETRHTQMLTLLEAPELPLCDRLEHHYRHRYAELQLTPSTTLDFDFNQAISGSGWHLREGDETAFRWTGPGTVSTLDFPLVSACDLTIEMSVVNALAPDVLQSLKLRVNDHPVSLGVLYAHNNAAIFQGRIPSSAFETDAPFTRLTFECDRTLSPQELDPESQDHRPLGLAFSRIQIFPDSPGKITAALFESQPWQEAADFVQAHLKPQHQILAPTVFRSRFPHHMPPYIAPPTAMGNYNPNLFSKNSPSQFDWAILHKGMMSEVGALLAKLAWRGFTPLYANEVFVVMGRGQPALSYTTPHVKSLYISYLKYFIRHPNHPWNRLRP